MGKFSRFVALLVFVAFAKTGLTQATTPTEAIAQLFAAIARADTALASEVCMRNTTFRSVVSETSVSGFGGGERRQEQTLAEFMTGLASLQPGQAEERTGAYDVRQDGSVASVVVPYQFYFGGERTHCGTNFFTLVRGGGGTWRIVDVLDTRRRSDCPDLDERATIATLDTLMDSWHRAAATADEDVFFGTMSADGIYLGTDATERWLRDSMAVWADPYFQREVAWAFTPRERHWGFSEDGRTAWFDEHLDSWMGVVRGSGVLTRLDEPNALGHDWELRHYNLALAVPNERMDAVRMAIDSTAKPR